MVIFVLSSLSSYFFLLTEPGLCEVKRISGFVVANSR